MEVWNLLETQSKLYLFRYFTLFLSHQPAGNWNIKFTGIKEILEPDIFQLSEVEQNIPLGWGGGGRGLDAMGTQPMAAALAKGSQAATDAISLNSFPKFS